MLPPPEVEYDSRENLQSTDHSWAIRHGYAVTIDGQ